MTTKSMNWTVSIFPKNQNESIARWNLSPSWIDWIEKSLDIALEDVVDLPHTLTPEEATILQNSIPYPFDLAQYDYVLDGEQKEEEFWVHQVVGICL